MAAKNKTVVFLEPIVQTKEIKGFLLMFCVGFVKEQSQPNSLSS